LCGEKLVDGGEGKRSMIAERFVGEKKKPRSRPRNQQHWPPTGGAATFCSRRTPKRRPAALGAWLLGKHP